MTPGARVLPFPRPPAEPPRIVTLDSLAPRFADRVRLVLADLKTHGQPGIVAEALRTSERQTWLYGFGRTWDDGRGIVTHASQPLLSWHYYGLAVDIWHESLMWRAPWEWWELLAQCAEAHGLVAGQHWRERKRDGPHIQWGNGMRLTPSWRAPLLLQAGGRVKVWQAVGAA